MELPIKENIRRHIYFTYKWTCLRWSLAWLHLNHALILLLQLLHVDGLVDLLLIECGGCVASSPNQDLLPQHSVLILLLLHDLLLASLHLHLVVVGLHLLKLLLLLLHRLWIAHVLLGSQLLLNSLYR